MKRALKLFSLCAVLALLSGCNKTEESAKGTSTNTPSATVTPSATDTGIQQTTTLNLMDKIVDGGDNVYTVNATAAETTLTYTKAEGTEWASAKIDLVDYDLSKMQSLKFSLKGEGKVCIKIQSDTGALEINLRLTEISGDYEWSLLKEDAVNVLSKPVTMYIFGLPGAVSGSGTVTFSRLEFSEEVADGFIIENGYTNIKADANEYDGTSATFDINHFWTQNDENSYEFTENADNTITVNYSQAEWQFAYSSLQGSGYGKFPYITIKAKGTEGDKVLFKVEPTGASPIEKTLTFTGGDDVFTFDLSSLTTEVRESINRVLMFAAPGMKNVKGTYTLQEVYYTMEMEVEEEPTVNNTFVYDGYGRFATIDVNQFKGLDDGVYSFANNVLTYTKSANQEWTAATLPLSGNFGDFTTIDYEIAIPAGKSLMLKLEGTYSNGNLEHTIVGNEDGSVVKGSFDLTSKTAAELNTATQLTMFAEPGSAEASSGTMTFNMLRFGGRVATEVTADGSVDLSKGMMFDLGDKVYDVTKNENNTYTIVTKEGKGDWACVGIRIQAPETTYSKITVTLSGSTEDSVLAKVENDFNGGEFQESQTTSLGEHVQIEFSITNALVNDPDTLILVFFVNPGTGNVAQPITVESIVFSN